MHTGGARGADSRIMGLDYFQIIARVLPKLDYNPRIRGCVEPCCSQLGAMAQFYTAIPLNVGL